jgi:hypothetical protein
VLQNETAPDLAASARMEDQRDHPAHLAERILVSADFAE